MSAVTTYPTGAHQLLAELMEANDIRPALSLVREVSRDGGRWLIATNGRVLFAQRSDDAPTEDLRGEGEEARTMTPAPERFAEVAFPAPDEAAIGTCTSEHLRGFVGVPDPIPTPIPCPVCDATGVVEHDCDCGYCDRDGEEECPECEGDKTITPLPRQRFGWIGAGVFDRNIIARVAHLLTDAEPYTVSLAPMQGGYRLRVVGSDHFAVVMSCRDEGTDEQRAAPYFEVTP